MIPSIYFNTQHSPIGAFASFTLEARGAVGGLGLELGKPADQNVFIGVADGNRITESASARYGWADNPEVNILNKVGLPASPFRTDFPSHESHS